MQVLKNIFSSLNPGGVFLLEIVSRDFIAANFQAKGWHEKEDGSLLLQERIVIDNWERLETRMVFLKDGQRKEKSLTMRMYTPTEFETMLKEVRFSVVQFYGDFDGRAYDQNVKRLVAVARR